MLQWAPARCVPLLIDRYAFYTQQREREREIMRISCNKTLLHPHYIISAFLLPGHLLPSFRSGTSFPHYFLQLRRTILRYTKRGELFAWKSLRDILFRKLYSRGHSNRKREWECLCPARGKLFGIPDLSSNLFISPIITTEFLVLSANATPHFPPSLRQRKRPWLC